MNTKSLIPTFTIWLPILFLLITICITNAIDIISTDNNSTVKYLSRKRRFLAFPDGSSLAIALCVTVGFVPTYLFPGFPYSLISIATNWGLVYNLPNATWIVHQLGKQSLKPKHKQIILRRNRRELYNNLEVIIDNMGYNGKECILKTLCESAQYFATKTKKTMLEEIIRTIFSFPKNKVFSFEPLDIKEYDEAYRYANNIDDCALVYSCEISLLDLAFGKYSESPQFSTNNHFFDSPGQFN